MRTTKRNGQVYKQQIGRRMMRNMPIKTVEGTIEWKVIRQQVPDWWPCMCNGGNNLCPICDCGIRENPPCAWCAPTPIQENALGQIVLGGHTPTEQDLNRAEYLDGEAYHQFDLDYPPYLRAHPSQDAQLALQVGRPGDYSIFDDPDELEAYWAAILTGAEDWDDLVA